MNKFFNYILVIVGWLPVQMLQAQTNVTITNIGVEVTVVGTDIYNCGTVVNRDTTISSINYSGLFVNDGNIHLKNDLDNRSKGNLFLTPVIALQNGRVLFEGTTTQKVIGDTSINFYKVYVTKAAVNDTLILKQTVNISDTLKMNTGNVFLNGKDINLSTTGLLYGETNASRIYGSSGVIKASKVISSPSFSSNYAGLGLMLNNSGISLGQATIQRGHAQQTGTADGSILRYYNLTRSSSGSISADIRMNYFNSNELGGTTPGNYVLWTSANSGVNWTNRGGTDAAQQVTATSVPVTNMRITAADPVCAAPPAISISPATVVKCSGDSAILDAGSFPGSVYQWSGASTAATQTIKIKLAGTYICTITDANGCVGKDTVVAVFSPSPTARFTYTSACEGFAASFNASSSIGASLTYGWMFGDAGTATGVTPTHTYNAQGMYSVNLLVTAPGGCTHDTTLDVPAYAKPDAGFSLTNTCVLTSASFTDTASVDTVGTLPTGYVLSWDFGDGQTSAATNPTHVYATDNTFPVRQIVTTSFGCKDTAYNSIIIYPKPNPGFSFANNSCAGSVVAFANASSINSGTITNYQWSFGDGNASTLFSPSNTYSPAGLYMVKLVETSDMFCKDSLTQTLTIRPLPIAAFTATNECVGSNISFSNTSSISGGTITYFWNFGDGTTSTSQNPAKNYAANGSYNVKLVVTSSFGCADSVTQVINVFPKPVAGFTSSNSCLNDSIVFTNTSTVASGTLTYAWSMGDGTNQATTNVTYTYPGVAAFTVSMIATSNNGCADTAATVINVYPLPTANFSAPNLCEGNATSFTNTSSITSGTLSYFWNFGNATTSVAANPLQSYSSSGAFNVELVSTSAFGCKDSITKAVSVFAKPVAAFTVNNVSVCLGTSSVFTNSSTIAGGTMTYNWNFGNATTSAAVNPVKTYAGPGSFNVIMIANSNKGCKDTANVIVTINPKPVANFTVNQVCGNDSVLITNTSTISGGTVSYLWNFGDGTTSTAFNPAKAYSAPGTYTIKLVVSSVFGCSDSISKTVNYPITPNTSFSFANTCTGQTTVFTNASTIGLGTLTYAWNFGDGGTSLLPSPSHAYAAANTYAVQLIATSQSGCKDTLIQAITINPKPSVNFTSSTNVCAGSAVSFTNNTTVSSGTLSYNWNFGDATSSTATNPNKLYASQGIYQVRLVANASGGCLDSITKTVSIKEKPVAAYTYNNACLGAVTNFVNTSAISAGTLSYSWNFGDATSSAVASPSKTYSNSGNYNVRLIAMASNGCSDTLINLVPVLAKPAVNFSSAQACGNDTMFFANTSSPATYTWAFGDGNTSAGTNPFNVYSSFGTYNVQLLATNGSGCVDSITKTVTKRAAPVAAFSSNTACLGTATVFTNTSTLAAGTLSYAWDFGNYSSSTVFSPSVVYANAVSYTVKLVATASTGCKDSLTQNITVNAVPVMNLGGNITTCGNQWVLDGQNPGSTYLWSDNSTSQTLTVLANGTYFVHVTLANGCAADDTSMITLNTTTKPQLGNDTTVCGSIALNAGYTGSTFLWNTGSTNQTITPTLSGTYDVTITDQNSCIGKDTIVIAVNAQPVVNLGADLNACYTTGIILDAQNAGLSYLWNDNSVAQTLNPLNSGLYWVKVTDGLNCSRTDSVIISFMSLPSPAFGADTISCLPVTLNALNAGAAYLWNDNSAGQTLLASVTGTYNVAITGANTCIRYDTIGVIINSAPVVNLGADISTCDNSSAMLNAGNPGAMYLWSDNSTAQTLAPLLSGQYVVVVSLPGGCSASDTINVSIAQAPVVSLGNDTAVCGSVNLNAGNAGAAYLWNDNSTAQILNAATAGQYWVNVTAGNGCVNSDTINVGVNNVVVNLGPNQTACAGVGITLDAGNPGATYAWSSTQSTQTIQPASSGIYSVLVTDAIGCTGTGNVTVTINAVPLLPFGNDTTVCAGITLNAGNSGSTYAWSTTATTQTIQVTGSGTYTVLITGANTCTTNDTIAVTVNPAVSVNLGSNISACAQTSTLLDAGNAGSTYLWNTGAVTQTISPVLSANYWVIVTDAAGCAGGDTVAVNFLPTPYVDLGPDTSACSSFVLNAQNIGSPYLWSTGATTQTLNVTSSGTYFVAVTGANTCVGKDTIVVSVNLAPVVNLGTNVPGCTGDPVVLNAGNPSAAYLWNSGATTQTINALVTGFYQVTVTDTNSCTASANVIVTFNNKPTYNLGPDRSVCGSTVLNAANNGSAYLWSNGSAGQTLTANTSGLYAVTVTNPYSCSISDTVNLTVNPLVAVDLGNDTAVCQGNAVLLDAGNSGATYQWNTGALTQTVNTVNTGTYIVKVTSPVGCIGYDSISVNVVSMPVVNLGFDVTLCKGSTVNIDAANQGAAYLWGSTVTGFSSTSRIIAAQDTGTYWVNVSNAIGCSASDTIIVRLDDDYVEAKFLAVSQAHIGDTVLFINVSNPVPDNNWWNFSDGLTSTAGSPSHIFYTANMFPVALAVSKSNCADTMVKTLNIQLRQGPPVDSLVTFLPPDIIDANLYPNPTTGSFRLDVTLNVASPLSIQIFDMEGRLLMYHATVANVYSGNYDISTLAAGIYLVRLTAGQDQKTLKVVKVY